jgi:hypothetical protein
MRKAVNHFLPHAAFAVAAAGATLLLAMAVPAPMGLGAPKAALTAPVTQAPLPGKELVPVAKLSAEGTLLGAPRMIDRGVAALVEPGIMSVVFSDEKTAWDFYHEAVGNGESVCLSDLGPQTKEFRGQRYWLRSC